jgi:hypothetical protein
MIVIRQKYVNMCMNFNRMHEHLLLLVIQVLQFAVLLNHKWLELLAHIFEA